MLPEAQCKQTHADSATRPRSSVLLAGVVRLSDALEIKATRSCHTSLVTFVRTFYSSVRIAKSGPQPGTGVRHLKRSANST